jgi:16S rRNA (guanine527-N7)-methyltransferase
LLGPGPLEVHLDHAAGFAAALAAAFDGEVGVGVEPARAGDLGSGGGVPGLPLAFVFVAWRWVLIDANQRRAAFLRAAVAELGLTGRVEVREQRAEEAGRDPSLRGQLDAVVARGFGPPAVVAECAAPLLRAGGRAVVSEPPGGAAERWPSDGLARLGMAPASGLTFGGASFQVLLQLSPCADRYPRRIGVPAKRPLF